MAEKEIIPLNTDRVGCSATLKANYYKMSPANFVGHLKDGFKATCIMEITNQSPVLCEGAPPKIPRSVDEATVNINKD